MKSQAIKWGCILSRVNGMCAHFYSNLQVKYFSENDKWQRGDTVSEDLLYSSCCSNLYQTATGADSQKPSGEKVGSSSKSTGCVLWGFSVPLKKDSSVWAEPTLLQRPQNQNKPKCWWFQSCGRGWLNERRRWCPNGAARRTSPRENKLASTLIPRPASASLVLPLLPGVLVKENISLQAWVYRPDRSIHF